MKRKEEEKGDIKNREIETMRMEHRESVRGRERENKVEYKKFYINVFHSYINIVF